MNGTTCINLSSYQYCTFLEWVHACTCTVYNDVQGGFWVFSSLNEILECDYSNESYWAVLSCAGTDYYAVQVGYNIWAAFK